MLARICFPSVIGEKGAHSTLRKPKLIEPAVNRVIENATPADATPRPRASKVDAGWRNEIKRGNVSMLLS